MHFNNVPLNGHIIIIIMIIIIIILIVITVIITNVIIVTLDMLEFRVNLMLHFKLRVDIQRMFHNRLASNIL